MKNKLIETLETLNYPVFLQGGLNDAADYPESFFTFWNFQANEETHYNNIPVSCVWGFWIYFYSTDPILVEQVPLQAKKLLADVGFIFDGKPTDANSDTQTHTGCMLTCYYIEKY